MSATSIKQESTLATPLVEKADARAHLQHHEYQDFDISPPKHSNFAADN
jgi:hypothetical protein